MKGPRNSLIKIAVTVSLIGAVIFVLLFSGMSKMLGLTLLLLTISNAAIIWFFKAKTTNFILDLSKITGNTTDNLHEHVETIARREEEVITFIDSIRKNETVKPFVYLSKEKGVGSNLLALTDKLHEYRVDENKRSWAQGGLARFSELQKDGKTINDFAFKVISFLVRYLEANQGGLFVASTDPVTNERFMELKGCYAYDKKKFLDKRVVEGDGLLGECMLSKSTIFMTDVPTNYVHITSGLGDALPRNIIISPLLYNGEFYGAVEIASFQLLQDYQIAFLEKVCEYIAGEISSRKSVQDTEKLLTESQELTHKLKEHEEEMRQHMEELTATQEQMRRKQSELDSVFSAINNTVASIEFDLSGNVISGNSIFLGISGYTTERLTGLNYLRLLPHNERDKPQHEMMWKNLRDGKFFSGEFKMLSDDGEEMWMSGTFNPIVDGSNRPYKIIMIAQFTTQEKAKQTEMNGTIAAAKNAVPFLEIDTDFRCKTANDRFLKLFGIKRMDLKDKPFSSLLVPKLGNLFAKNHMTLKDQKYFEEILNFSIGDEAVSFVTCFTPIRDHNNQTTRIVVILSDKLQAVKIAAVA